MWNKLFVWNLSSWLKITLKTLEITSDRGLVLKFFEATMNIAPIGVLCIFSNQYMMERALCCSIKVNFFFAVFDVNFNFNNFLVRLSYLWICWCYIYTWVTLRQSFHRSTLSIHWYIAQTFWAIYQGILNVSSAQSSSIQSF